MRYFRRVTVANLKNSRLTCPAPNCECDLMIYDLESLCCEGCGTDKIFLVCRGDSCNYSIAKASHDIRYPETKNNPIAITHIYPSKKEMKAAIKRGSYPA